jgi:hypothetical protein
MKGSDQTAVSASPARKGSLPDHPLKSRSSFHDVAALWKEKEQRQPSPGQLKRSPSSHMVYSARPSSLGLWPTLSRVLVDDHQPPPLVSTGGGFFKREAVAERKKVVEACVAPSVVLTRQRTASVEYAKQREADALLPWTHKVDTREVFEQRTPQQWKQEKEALEKRVISPRKDPTSAASLRKVGVKPIMMNNNNGMESDDNVITNNKRKTAKLAKLDKQQKKVDEARRELERERQEMADERWRLDTEWRVLGAEKLRMHDEQREAKKRLRDAWASVDEEKRKLWEQYKELEELLSRLYNTPDSFL